MGDPRQDTHNPVPFVVMWEATVYGSTVVYATDREGAMREAKKEVTPTRDADDYTGSIEFVDVYPE